MAKKEQTNLEVKEPTSLDELDFSQKADGLFAGFVEPEEEDLTTGEDDEQEGGEPEEEESGEAGEEEVVSEETTEETGESEQPGEEPAKPDDQPIVVLKRYGQEYPVTDKDSLVKLAQMGLDYTFKTQQLSGWRKVIEALQGNPDLMEVVEKRMRGEGGAIPTTASAKADVDKKADDLSVAPQGDDESFEEYVARVAEATVQRQNAVNSQEISKLRNATIMYHVRQDPLFEPTSQVIAHWVTRGEIPPDVAKRADQDPQAFIELYQRARVAAEQWVNQQKQASQPAAAAAQAKPAPKAPVVESARNSHAVNKPAETKQKWSDRGVIKDLSDPDFEMLIERVKTGGI